MDPPPRGAIVVRAPRHREEAAVLAREALSALRALKAEAAQEERAAPGLDFVVLLVDEDAAVGDLPDLKDRAGTAIAVAGEEAEGRAAVAKARRALRAKAAVLGPRELVLGPAHFGILGLESDGHREKLHILLQALVLDADRLRLRREGWEEPDKST